jgi:hypothetical protein
MREPEPISVGMSAGIPGVVIVSSVVSFPPPVSLPPPLSFRKA